MYTTNDIESLNCTLRKSPITAMLFLMATKYLVINNISKKWTLTVQNWGVMKNQGSILMEIDRNYDQKTNYKLLKAALLSGCRSSMPMKTD